MRSYSVMIKPASSLCDLRCKYCFYADVANQRSVRSFGMMQPETLEKILENIRRSVGPGDRVSLVFQGGEPTLAGLDFFRAVTAAVDRWDNRIHVDYALQTNAMHLDDEWCRFLREYHFLVGVSYDLLPECQDGVRVDAGGGPTGQRVLKAISLLRQYGVEFNVLCTLTNQIARHPQRVWKQIVEKKLQYVQFTPCLDELEHPGESIYAITPKRFAYFYNTLYGFWLSDYQAGKYRSIKLFDDVIHFMAFGIPTACGMGGRCQSQLVVEADGTVYPCDFYCLDRYVLGNLTEKTIPELLESPAAAEFLTRPVSIPALCAGCSLREFCGGGCARMRSGICCSGSASFCGYQAFLMQNLPSLQRIAMAERRAR